MQISGFFICTAAVLIVGTMVAVVISRRESHRIRAIRALANRLKFRPVTPNGAERTTTSINLSQHREYAFLNVYSGVVSGMGVTFFDLACSQNSTEKLACDSMENTEITTRVKVHLKGQSLPHFILLPQMVMATMKHQLPKTTLITFPEDRTFDRDNILLGDDAGSIRRLFDSSALRAMFANNKTMCIEGKRDTITVYWRHMLLSANQLESLIERTVKVAGTMTHCTT